jgi:predicted acetyltransferase
MDDLHLAVASEAQRAELTPILAHSFGFPATDTPGWFDRAGHDNVLAFGDGAQVAGGLLLVPMGQWFGGRSVPLHGVAGVGVTPERRGSGVATRMMAAALRTMRDRGAALSTLYPATVPLYQRVGYERAGHRYELTIRPQELERSAAGSQGFRVERIASHEHDGLRAQQRLFASRTHGGLDRGRYIWERCFRPWRQETAAFVLREGEAVAGHLVLVHRMDDQGKNSVRVTDASARDGRAARAVFGTLAGYRSLVGQVTWSMALPGVFLPQLAERHYEVAVTDTWMLRLLDVAKALEARGYPRSLTATLDLALSGDGVFPENEGGYRLRVEAGRAHVERGEAAGESLRLSVRALASLYSGLLSASELVRLGWAEGSEQAISTADEVFAGPTPCMAEMF